MLTSCTTSGWFLCLSILASILWSSCATESQTYTILTPENPFCLTNSTCFTLAEFASTTFYHSDIVSLNFLPGNHSLNVKMILNDMQEFSMYADSLSRAKGAVINCSPSAEILFIGCDHVYVSNLQFNDCAGNIIECVNFTIMYSSFVGLNQFNHTAIILNGTGYLQIIQSHFLLYSKTSYSSISIPERQKGIINATLCEMVVIMNSSFVRNMRAILIFTQHMTKLVIKNSLFEENSVDAIILAESNSLISIYNSSFTKNSFIGAAFELQIINSILNVNLTRLTHNESIETGRAIYALESSVSIKNSTFKQFNGSHNGGVIACFGGNISIHASIFEHNSARGQGGVLYANSTDVLIKESQFRFNYALIGGVLSLHSGKAIINESKFTSNRAWASDIRGGARGGVLVADKTAINISDSKFENNSAESGGAMEFYDCDTMNLCKLSNIGFYYNSAEYKGILNIFKSEDFKASKLTFEYNHGEGGVIYIADSMVYFKNLSYSFNTGSIVVVFGGRLSLSKKCVFNSNTPKHLMNVPVLYDQGGVITSFQSRIVFEHSSDFEFINNHGRLGGAIYAVDSLINIKGDVLLSRNKAFENGGGMYLYETKVQIFCNLTFLQNFANDSGGGIYTVSSSLSILPDFLHSCTRARFSVIKNSASYGGGIFLSNHAKLYIFGEMGDDNEIIELNNNDANYGGALYIADDTNTDICYRSTDEYFSKTSNAECFFQNLVFDHQIYDRSTFNNQGFFHFQSNTAKDAGSNLFGGLLDRCLPNPYGNRLLQDIDTGFDSYLNYLNQGSVDLNSISSHPVRMCICVDNQPDCNQQPSTVYVKKGELFNNISVVAVDQVNHTVNATVLCTLFSPEAGLGEGQLSQASFEECTLLQFQLYSPLEAENLILYADGPCRDAKLSQLIIPVKFLPCTCPFGFQPSRSTETSCVCECDYRLQHYGIDCNVSSWSLIRENSYWINHVNMTENVSGFVYYAHCPYDYCHPRSFKLSIDLNTPSGADAQCSFNRTGVLCSACKPGLSLSLGTSRCLICPITWPVSMVFVLLASVFAGIFLVALILILDLTVAMGTINGFIFYANIIGANSRTYLPFAKPNFCTIFIAWFNLEFGFDLCFFEGMDAYAKSWLQLAFPVLLFLIVGAVIFISNHSSRFSRLIGKKNPVATLATLILLAFTKFLHTIIAIFSFAVLKYPNNTSSVVWLLDASVKYSKGKHIPLFLMAVLITIADFCFILLLLSWQLILYGSNAKILKWSKNTRIHNFMDSFLAPYTPKFRFWTGLLLFARVIIYLISTVNLSSDPVIDLIAVGVVMVCIFLLIVLLRERIYLKSSTELLEMSCYFNLFLFTIISFFSLKSPLYQRIFAQISVGIMFVAFILVILYHLFRTSKKFHPFSHLFTLIVMKVKRKPTNLSNSLKLQDIKLCPLSISSLTFKDLCPSCKVNETHTTEQKDEEINKGNGQKSSSGSFDPLGTIHEPLLEQAS